LGIIPKASLKVLHAKDSCVETKIENVCGTLKTKLAKISCDMKMHLIIDLSFKKTQQDIILNIGHFCAFKAASQDELRQKQTVTKVRTD